MAANIRDRERESGRGRKRERRETRHLLMEVHKTFYKVILPQDSNFHLITPVDLISSLYKHRQWRNMVNVSRKIHYSNSKLWKILQNK